jgi:VIT1/CCC1 family predicted Fe2+/Mn2+ transporter
MPTDLQLTALLALCAWAAGLFLALLGFILGVRAGLRRAIEINKKAWGG